MRPALAGMTPGLISRLAVLGSAGGWRKRQPAGFPWGRGAEAGGAQIRAARKGCWESRSHLGAWNQEYSGTTESLLNAVPRATTNEPIGIWALKVALLWHCWWGMGYENRKASQGAFSLCLCEPNACTERPSTVTLLRGQRSPALRWIERAPHFLATGRRPVRCSAGGA
jgi:hypothetical protein